MSLTQGENRAGPGAPEVSLRVKETSIEFESSVAGAVGIRLFDVSGRDLRREWVSHAQRGRQVIPGVLAGLPRPRG